MNTIKKIVALMIAAAAVIGICSLIFPFTRGGTEEAEAGSLSKHNDLVGVKPFPELDKVEATWTKPGKGIVGDVEWTQIKIGDDAYRIPDLFNHELVIDFNVGYYEYRGAHVKLDLQSYLDAGIKWRQAVAWETVEQVRQCDHYEDNGNDWFFRHYYWMRVPSAASYWRWRRGEGELKLLGEAGSY